MEVLARLRLYLWLSVAVAIVAMVGVLTVYYDMSFNDILPQQYASHESTHPQPVSSLETSGIGTDFTLTTHTGETITQDSWPDHYKMIFFGFTYCPDVCPTKLRKISQVLKDLNPVVVSRIQPLFITIDPNRDTVEQMANYVSLFHEDIVGLTGTQEQIDHVIDGFKVFAQKRDGNTPDSYMMDHSAFTYLMSPDNKLVDIMGYNTSHDEMVEMVHQNMGHYIDKAFTSSEDEQAENQMQ